MNIYEIEQSFLSIFEEIELNEGEITPKLEEQLQITQDEFRDKIKSYVNAIRLYKNQQNDIKAEIKRLKDLSDKKDKVIERLNNVVLDAVIKFGDTTKSGTKYFDYGLGKISIRRSNSIDTDDDTIKEIVSEFKNQINTLKETNQLSVQDNIDMSDFIKNIIQERGLNEDLSFEDLNNIKTSIVFDCSLASLMSTSGYSILSNILNNNINIDVKPNVSKSDIKNYLSDNENYLSIAKIKNNQSVIIT